MFCALEGSATNQGKGVACVRAAGIYIVSGTLDIWLSYQVPIGPKPVTQIKLHFWTMPCGLCKEHLLVLLPAFEIVQLECFELMHLATDPAVASLFDSFMPPHERCFLKENLCIVLLLDLPCSSSPPSPPSSTPTHSSHVPAASPRGFLPHLTTTSCHSTTCAIAQRCNTILTTPQLVP